MFLSAAKIHYLVAEKDMLASSDSVTADILAVSRQLAAGHGDYPKVQVVENDGRWFTLNNAQLGLYRQLEREGRGRQVQVDVVALSDVPQEVRRMMVVTLGSNDPVEDSSRSTAKGYSELGQRDGGDSAKKDDASDSDLAESADSDLDDTDSEFDWSDDDRDSSDTDDNEADGKSEKRSDDEKESLL